jgi:hypothetical protein
LAEEKLAYTKKQFAAAFGISLTTLWREERDGNLRTIKIRGRVLITAEEARRYLSGKEEAQNKVEVSQVAA